MTVIINIFFAQFISHSFLVLFFQLLLTMTSVECYLDLPVQGLHLQIAVELLVFDTAALKSDHFVRQKTMNFFVLLVCSLHDAIFPNVNGRPIILASEMALST